MTREGRRRIPAAEHREALVTAAVHEFARGGLHGTPVAAIARRAGVVQPYVFSLFASKRELFLAAVTRAFERIEELLVSAAGAFTEGRSPDDCVDALGAMRRAYSGALTADDGRDLLLLQHHAYAACGDIVIRQSVIGLYSNLITKVARVSEAPHEQLDELFRYGTWLNVMAAIGAARAGGTMTSSTVALITTPPTA